MSASATDEHLDGWCSVHQTTVARTGGGDATSEAAMVQDGRRLRRQRNIDAVHTAILTMLEEWETPTLAEVAHRSGVTVRSIYRYHEDLESAVDAACDRRTAELAEVMDALGPVDAASPFERRVGAMVTRRMQLERLGRPLRGRSPDPVLLDRLDSESRRVFQPELDRFPGSLRKAADSTVSYLLRPRSIRSLTEPLDDQAGAATTLTFALHRVLLGGSEDISLRLN